MTHREPGQVTSCTFASLAKFYVFNSDQEVAKRTIDLDDVAFCGQPIAFL
jgi:hypothetical protein